MKVLRFFGCIICFCSLSSAAQNLSHVPPLIGPATNRDSSKSLLFNTMDIRRMEQKHIETPYANTIQIADTDVPWPPRWYTAVPAYSNEMYDTDVKNGTMRFDFMLDAKAEGGYFSFFKSIVHLNTDHSGTNSTPFKGYILLNKKMQPVDTVVSTTPNTYIYWHDFRINPNGERLISIKVEERLNISKRTGNAADTAVKSSVDIIQVVDKDNRVEFSWKATDGLPADIFEYEQSLKAISFARGNANADFIDWSHLTSTVWDYDGNILYALRFIGIGKISREDGHVMWKINYNDLPLVSGKDSLYWDFPHDLNFLYETKTSAVYSLFSLGKKPTRRSNAVIFEVNKLTNKVSLIRRLYPHKKYTAEGQGSCDYSQNGDYVFSLGVYWNDSDSSTFWDAIEYGNTAGKYSMYKLPNGVHAYKAHLLKNWPRPPRPVIVSDGVTLTAKGEMTHYTWYKLTGPNLTQVTVVGTGTKIKAEKGVTYCVEGEYGIGYSVSKPYKNRL